ncbi:uncharacterized protein BXIN_1880 [Babesia sp. Xinjiang]|uniref:uncharacterized protein n=1 Tax=Babesia sp. Xinjiang TaxID=462227 RepID=UPI000A22399C|nr:uncharacterized protein BXIN_1880 [Babesia sp. Xinjiang]ORM40342.1 hypothetical protein BXIN_1880 [Babesia sp. Xinjiang]
MNEESDSEVKRDPLTARPSGSGKRLPLDIEGNNICQDIETTAIDDTHEDVSQDADIEISQKNIEQKETLQQEIQRQSLDTTDTNRNNADNGIDTHQNVVTTRNTMDRESIIYDNRNLSPRRSRGSSISVSNTPTSTGDSIQSLPSSYEGEPINDDSLFSEQSPKVQRLIITQQTLRNSPIILPPSIRDSVVSDRFLAAVERSSDPLGRVASIYHTGRERADSHRASVPITFDGDANAATHGYNISTRAMAAARSIVSTGSSATGATSRTISTMSPVGSVVTGTSQYSENESQSQIDPLDITLHFTTTDGNNGGITSRSEPQTNNDLEMRYRQINDGSSTADDIDTRITNNYLERTQSSASNQYSIGDASTRHSTDEPSRSSMDEWSSRQSNPQYASSSEYRTPESNVMMRENNSAQATTPTAQNQHSTHMSQQSTIQRPTQHGTENDNARQQTGNIQQYNTRDGDTQHDRFSYDSKDSQREHRIQSYCQDFEQIMSERLRGTISDDNQLIDEDDDEEGNIFLIPDNFNPYAPPTQRNSNMATTTLIEASQVYNIQDNFDEEDYDNHDTLNFTFSHGDAECLLQQHDIQSEQTSEIRTPSRPIVIEDDNTSILSEQNRKSDEMTFSDRVQQLVESERTSRGRDETKVRSIDLADRFKELDRQLISPKSLQKNDDINSSVRRSVTPMNVDDGIQEDTVLTTLIEARIQNNATLTGLHTPTMGNTLLQHNEVNKHPPPNPLSPTITTDHNKTDQISHTSDLASSKTIKSTGSANVIGTAMSSSTPSDGMKNTHFTADSEPLYMKTFYANLFREKTQRRDETNTPFDKNIPVATNSKRPKVSGKDTLLIDDLESVAPKMRAITPSAERIVADAFKSVKIVIGAKLCENGYHRQPGDATPLNSRTNPYRKVQDDTKALLKEFIGKLKAVNAIKVQLYNCLDNATKNSTLKDGSKATYAALVKECLQLNKSIQHREMFMGLQRKMMNMKIERLKRLKEKITLLELRNRTAQTDGTISEQPERNISTISNVYTATGIRIVPVDVGIPHVRWCFVVAFNADPNTKRFVRRYTKSWKTDVVKMVDSCIDTILQKAVVYHRLKIDQRYNPEVDMLVYLRVMGDSAAQGDFYASCKRSVLTFDEDSSPEVQEATRTPSGRAHVPAFRSSEIPSSSPETVSTPTISKRIDCRTWSNVSGIRSTTSLANGVESINPPYGSPGPTEPPRIAAKDVTWDDEVDIDELITGLRIVFTAPRLKAGGDKGKVWEQALMQLLNAANKRIDRLKSRLTLDKTADQRPITLLALIREIMDYGSALSSRIRVVQRELLQLLNSTSVPVIKASGNLMTIEMVLTPQEPAKPSLRCSLDIDPYDLLQKGSYARAATNFKVQPLQPGNDALQKKVKEAIIETPKDKTIYHVISSACARIGHNLYN